MAPRSAALQMGSVRVQHSNRMGRSGNSFNLLRSGSAKSVECLTTLLQTQTERRAEQNAAFYWRRPPNLFCCCKVCLEQVYVRYKVSLNASRHSKLPQIRGWGKKLSSCNLQLLPTTHSRLWLQAVWAVTQTNCFGMPKEVATQRTLQQHPTT